MSGRTRKGNRLLRTVLIEAARAGRTATYFGAQYRRLAARRDHARAAVAVAHSILVIIYHLLRDPTATFRDLGLAYFDQRVRFATERRAVRRLEALAYRVTLDPAVA